MHGWNTATAIVAVHSKNASRMWMPANIISTPLNAISKDSLTSIALLNPNRERA